MINWIKEHKIPTAIITTIVGFAVNFLLQKYFNTGIDLKLVFGEIDLSTLIIMVLIICAIICFYKGFTRDESDWVWNGVWFIIFAIVLISLHSLFTNIMDNSFSSCVEKAYRNKRNETLKDIKEYCTLMYKNNN